MILSVLFLFTIRYSKAQVECFQYKDKIVTNLVFIF